jgi:hypothetical protein
VVGVHGGANTGWIRLAFVAPRPPFRLFRYELVIDPATVYTDGQIVKHVILSLTATVLTYVIGMVPNLEFWWRPRSAQIKIRPDAVEFTHFELKLPSAASPWAGKNLFFL